MVDSVLTPGMLRLVVGAEVVFTANVNPPFIVNGTKGVVTATDPDQPTVSIKGVDHVVQRFQFSRRVNTGKGSTVTVTMSQFPLQHGWALTIHKAQGMTLDLVEIDLGPSVFSDGQAYVGLSRVPCLAGLSIRTFDARCIRAKGEVREWMAAHAATKPCDGKPEG